MSELPKQDSLNAMYEEAIFNRFRQIGDSPVGHLDDWQDVFSWVDPKFSQLSRPRPESIDSLERIAAVLEDQNQITFDYDPLHPFVSELKLLTSPSASYEAFASSLERASALMKRLKPHECEIGGIQIRINRPSRQIDSIGVVIPYDVNVYKDQESWMETGHMGVDHDEKSGLLKVREVQVDTSRIVDKLLFLASLGGRFARSTAVRDRMKMASRLGRLLSKVRGKVREGRPRAEESYIGFQSVGTEELMMLILKELLQADKVEIPHAHETYWGNPELIEVFGFGINSVRDRALGYAMVLLPSAVREELMYLIGDKLPKNPKVSDVGGELFRLALDRMDADSGDTALADLLIDLLVAREDLNRMITQDTLRSLRGSDFRTRMSTLAYHTIEYTQVFAPYFFAFSDVAHEKTPVGRLFRASDLDRLPVMEEIKRTLKKVEELD